MAVGTGSRSPEISINRAGCGALEPHKLVRQQTGWGPGDDVDAKGVGGSSPRLRSRKKRVATRKHTAGSVGAYCSVPVRVDRDTAHRPHHRSVTGSPCSPFAGQLAIRSGKWPMSCGITCQCSRKSSRGRRARGLRAHDCQSCPVWMGLSLRPARYPGGVQHMRRLWGGPGKGAESMTSDLWHAPGSHPRSGSEDRRQAGRWQAGGRCPASSPPGLLVVLERDEERSAGAVAGYRRRGGARKKGRAAFCSPNRGREEETWDQRCVISTDALDRFARPARQRWPGSQPFAGNRSSGRFFGRFPRNAQ
jgi:hypothetical protein